MTRSPRPGRAIGVGLLSMSPVALAGEGSLHLNVFFNTVMFALLTAVILTVQLVYALGLKRVSWKMKILLAVLMLTVDLVTGMLIVAGAERYGIPLDHALTFLVAGVPGFLFVFLAHRWLKRQPGLLRSL